MCHLEVVERDQFLAEIGDWNRDVVPLLWTAVRDCPVVSTKSLDLVIHGPLLSLLPDLIKILLADSVLLVKLDRQCDLHLVI